MTKRILVVEDQEDLRDVLRTLLVGSGYEMLEAADGEAGVAKAQSDRPDLMVRVHPPSDSGPLLAKYKLKFGPAVLIDNRLEFVGVPRYRMLLERIEISKRRALAPPQPPAAAAPPAPAPAKPAPATPPATPPAKPAGPTS